MQRKHVLLVDDDPSVRSSLKAALASAGFDVTLARDGREGKDRFRALPELDLCVTDVAMPYLSGIELLSYIRAKRPSLPVIVMSSASMYRLPALQGGAFTFLDKPVSKDDLLAEVRTALRIAPLADDSGS